MEWPFVMRMIRETPTDVLMKSRKHCHARNVHSIVIRERYEKLTRVFLAMPDHPLWANGAAGYKYAVGIHDHQYSLQISHVFGTVMHMLYQRGKNRFAEELYEFRFKSGGCNGKPDVEMLGKTFIMPTSIYRILGSVTIGHDSLHTMSVPRNEPAAWMVSEGERVKGTTTLFSDMPTITTEGFYQPFENLDEIYSIVESMKNET